jgi:hypothetical protein
VPLSLSGAGAAYPIFTGAQLPEYNTIVTVNTVTSGTILYGIGLNCNYNLGLPQIDSYYDSFGSFTWGTATTLIRILSSKNLTNETCNPSLTTVKIERNDSSTYLLSGGLIFYTGNAFGNDETKCFTHSASLSGTYDDIVCGATHLLALSGKKMFGLGTNYIRPDADYIPTYVFGMPNLTNNTYTSLQAITGSWDKVWAGSNVSYALSGNTLFIAGDPLTAGVQNRPLTANNTSIPNYFKEWTPIAKFSENLNTIKLVNVGTGGSAPEYLTKAYAFLLYNNKLSAIGYNDYGQFGLGDTQKRSSWTPVTGSFDDIAISTSCTTLAISSNNTIVGAGQLTFGALIKSVYPLGSYSTTFFSLSAPKNIIFTKVACAGQNSFVMGYYSPYVPAPTPTLTPTPTPTSTPTPTPQPTPAPQNNYLYKNSSF